VIARKATFHDVLEFVIGGDVARRDKEQVVLEVRRECPCADPATQSA